MFQRHNWKLLFLAFQDIGPTYFTLIMAIDDIHQNNKKILHYAWVNFPLGYTQVATFAVYAYFVAELFASQFFYPEQETKSKASTVTNTYIDESKLSSYWDHFPDIYVPIYTILEFVSYMGWIKLAEALLNPWGEDDQVILPIYRKIKY